MQIFLRVAIAIGFLAAGYFVSKSFFDDKDTKKGQRSAHARQAHKAPSGKGKGKGRGKGKGKNKANGAGKSKSKETVQTKGANIKHRSNGIETTVSKLSPSDYQVYLQTQGTVKPRTETKLNALVSGRITHISAQFQDGAFFKKGDLLIELDPTDYASKIISAKATLARAEATLAQEQARAAQALRNWQDIGFKEEPNDLVLRKPQLNEARANVEAQKASLEKANRDLDRTKIYAPFDGRVRKRNVGPGESISANSSLAEIYTTDYAEIRLPLSARQLTQININEQGNQAIPVDLTDALNQSNKTIWKAVIKHVEGELDEVSRELNVIAHIPDPFGNSTGHAPLRMNQPVKASITANVIQNAYAINRKYLYGANEILLIENSRIVKKEIDILWNTKDYVITTDTGLAGKLLATSRINYAKTGTPVQVIPDTDEKNSETTPAAKKGHGAPVTSGH